LQRAKEIVTRYRKGEDIPGLKEDDLWRAKNIYDSAYHPDTGEKMMLIGRMSAQVPLNMIITGCMLTFYKSPKAIIFWQGTNQSLNAVVNYSNRSGDSPINVRQLGTSYVLATGGALVTGLGLNALFKTAPGIMGRLIPFIAVAAANCINVPVMRIEEIRHGTQVTDAHGSRLGVSAVAGREGIAKVVFSRIGMTIPVMVFPAIIMSRLETRGTLRRYPFIGAPIQVLLCGGCLMFATPMRCAMFPQKSCIAVAKLEPELQERIKMLPTPPQVVYYNKGL
jgi:tricarboxylate carrier